jgi:membrane-bound ClpP family serine protease
MSSGSHFTAGLFLRYWLFCTALVLLTYNPFRHSFYHWVSGGTGDWLLKLVVGLILLFTTVFLVWVIFGSVGAIGVTIGALSWGLLSHQVLTALSVQAPLLRELVVLICLATLLAVGLSWPHFIFRLSGQEEKRYLTKDKKKIGAGP